MTYKFGIWWDYYTPAVEAQIVKDIMLLRTYTPVVDVVLFVKPEESLKSAFGMLGVSYTIQSTKEHNANESKAYVTSESTNPPGMCEIVQNLFCKTSTQHMTGPGEPLVVDPPKIVPAPPQLSPNHKTEPPRTPCTILPPWLTN